MEHNTTTGTALFTGELGNVLGDGRSLWLKAVISISAERDEEVISYRLQSEPVTDFLLICKNDAWKFLVLPRLVSCYPMANMQNEHKGNLTVYSITDIFINPPNY